MWKDYFSFNKRQRNGIIVLLAIIAIMITWLFVSDHLTPPMGKLTLSNIKLADTNNTVENEGQRSTDTTHIRKLNINTCSIKELARNPNIGYFLSQAIVNYRMQHGNYKTMQDLFKSAAIDKETYNKISPYLTVN
jgi:competence ComEA-like helix-hairpin-helix protein